MTMSEGSLPNTPARKYINFLYTGGTSLTQGNMGVIRLLYLIDIKSDPNSFQLFIGIVYR